MSQNPQRRRRPGYFRSLFDLSYGNLGAPAFARVFQLLFIIVSSIAFVVGLGFVFSRGVESPETLLFTVIAILLGLVVWLLLNTLVRLVLEAVVGIVQTAENSEEMLEIMRRQGSR